MSSICNICGRTLSESEKLTKDHVPIKRSHPFFRLYKESLIKRFGDTIDKRPRRIEQNGVIFETICGDCNNRVLGANYDPAFCKFMNAVKRIAKLKLIAVHKTVEIEAQPVAIAKSVLGHLMAARGNTAASDYDRMWKEAVLDPVLPIPENVHIYYWFYPYTDYINVFRDVAVLTDKQASACSFISCFPVGFLVSDQPTYEGLLELTARRNLTIGDRITVPLRLTDDLGPFWPLQSNNRTIFMFGKSGMDSVNAEIKN